LPSPGCPVRCDGRIASWDEAEEVFRPYPVVPRQARCRWLLQVSVLPRWAPIAVACGKPGSCVGKANRSGIRVLRVLQGCGTTILAEADVSGGEGSPMSGEASMSTSTPISRRTLLKRLAFGAGGAVVLAGTGVGVYEWVTSSPSPRGPEPLHFRSRPDLAPPVVTIDVPAGGTAPGLVFLSPSGPGQPGPMIVDNDGQLVWFHPIKPIPGAAITAATNFKVQQLNGEPVLTWWEGQVVIPQGFGRGEYVIADTSYREITRVRAVGNGLAGDLHEFLLSPQGVAFFTIYHPVRANLTSVGGPRNGMLLLSKAQGVDVRTGEVVFNWDPREHIELDESYVPASNIEIDGGLYDYLHMNSIDVDTDGNLLISARHTCAVYKIDRSTGKIIWRLNGKKSDFEMGDGAQFFFQHDARAHADGTITLFDDGAGPPDASLRSRGMRLSLDFASMKATLAEQFLPLPSFLSTSQGSVQTLDNSNVFVGWGSEPYVSEYTSDGRLLFVAQLPSGFASYRGFRFPWVARPTGRPSAVVQQDSSGRAIVYTSWNGATEVKSWRVLVGDSAGSLTLSTSAPKRGFETAIPVGAGAIFVATEALDEQGQSLGQSKPIGI